MLPNGRVRHLGHFEDDLTEFDGVYGFALAGRFVAYEDAFCDNTACDGSIKVLNIGSRQMVHRARIPPGEGEERVIVVNGRGSVAWTRATTVWKCDAPKCVRLDQSQALDSRSLKLRSHTLHWRHVDGTTYSASLK